MDLHTTNERPQLNGLSLCSGGGMLDVGVGLALDYFGIDYRTVGYVERDSYAAAVLLARMADESLERAPVCDALENITSVWRGTVDCLTAGFPCQPWSCAGRGGGFDDPRWLWPSIFRIVLDVRPGLIFLENVPGLVTRHGLDRVLSDLASVGFDAEWGHLRAEAVGASHRRDRVFVLAYVPESRVGRLAIEGRSGPELGHAACNNERRDPVSGLDGERQQAGGSSRQLGDAQRTRQQERPSERCDVQREQQTIERTGDPLFTPGRNDPRWERIINTLARLDPATSRASSWQLACDTYCERRGAFDAESRRQLVHTKEAQSAIRRLAHGLARLVDHARADRLRVSGNGVVPLQAAACLVELVRRAGVESVFDPTRRAVSDDVIAITQQSRRGRR